MSTQKVNGTGECDCSCKCEDGSLDTIDSNGRCPCECECKGCRLSKILKSGCDCPEDEKTCPGGIEGFWQDCKLQCNSGCGKAPSCLPGVQGEYCHLPRCPNRCPSCNNGRCVLGQNCNSFCQCNNGWTGQCCDVQGTNGFGDVHYQTLDELYYDFQGVGEFWYCQDIESDLGIQARAYMTKLNSSVSWLAGLSVKLKSHVLSAFLGPVVRLDGQIIKQSSERSLEEDHSVHLSITFDDNGHPEILAQVKERFAIRITYSTSSAFGFYEIDFTLDQSNTKAKTRGLCGTNDG